MERTVCRCRRDTAPTGSAVWAGRRTGRLQVRCLSARDAVTQTPPGERSAPPGDLGGQPTTAPGRPTTSAGPSNNTLGVSAPRQYPPQTTR
ncbi:hypothetical protein LSAT2_017710 [Lamellibrachia satsuma]|nr:hypothetical protein LSAT2_017710 [Lamellibrachia satsuma]